MRYSKATMGTRDSHMRIVGSKQTMLEVAQKLLCLTYKNFSLLGGPPFI